MTRISEVERPGLATRVFYGIGKAMFGQVPTPQRIMAHRVVLMLGLGGLYAALEWAGRIEATLDKTELEEARWFSRDDVGAALNEDGTASFEPPPKTAIARTLLEGWFHRLS